jgi:HPt (histidine-containing phosphotransfer) domain-containing protein
MYVEHDNKASSHHSPGTLENDVGPDVYKELLETFLTHLLVQAVELDNAATNGNVAAAQDVAHQIKGTATGFGAGHLDELAECVMAMDGDEPALLQTLVRQIDAEICSLHAGVRESAGRQ